MTVKASGVNTLKIEMSVNSSLVIILILDFVDDDHVVSVLFIHLFTFHLFIYLKLKLFERFLKNYRRKFFCRKETSQNVERRYANIRFTN